MDIRKIKIADLKEYENNPVIHSKEQISKLAGIIKQYGFRQPIVIDKDYTIVAGHGRLQAVKKLGYEEIDCVVADDLSEEEIRAYRLADNKIKELRWDPVEGDTIFLKKLIIKLIYTDETFEYIPEHWVCPIYGFGKDVFVPLEE